MRSIFFFLRLIGFALNGCGPEASSEMTPHPALPEPAVNAELTGETSSKTQEPLHLSDLCGKVVIFEM